MPPTCLAVLLAGPVVGESLHGSLNSTLLYVARHTFRIAIPVDHLFPR